MKLDLTFKDICKSIKQYGSSDPKLLNAVDSLLGLALIMSPMPLQGVLATFLPTLGVKNELTKVGKLVFEKITEQPKDNYVERLNAMQLAHALIVFSSFFDAVDLCLEARLRSQLSLSPAEKARLSVDASKEVAEQLDRVSDLYRDNLTNVPIAFPQPGEGVADQMLRHEFIWRSLAQGLIGFVRNLDAWASMPTLDQEDMLRSLAGIERTAATLFEAQYFQLSVNFEEFAIWANLHEHERTKELLGKISDRLRDYAQLCESSLREADVGFENLQASIASIPAALRSSEARIIFDSLKKHYDARINGPVVNDTSATGEALAITFPSIREAFIPQAFLSLRQGTVPIRFEADETWKELKKDQDIGKFLINHLSSPYSINSPLLILGNPGSGKSLLTRVIAARFMATRFTVVRVPLREVHADADVYSQIEETLKNVTRAGSGCWRVLAEAFADLPPLVILDGYDELLQASGKVFAGYLQGVQRFQEAEAEQGRPVRVIVTSRVTLIDKASVPPGTTVVKLLDFDSVRTARWISTWNAVNQSFFKQRKVRPFELPKVKKKENRKKKTTADGESGEDDDKIYLLARQPLLLLMLALYDSDGNSLHSGLGISRTSLYNSLVNRFVLRECLKDNAFGNLSPKEKEEVIEREINRIRIAALGMYNRRKLHILSEELSDDLRSFGVEVGQNPTAGRSLTQADMLLGAFFFVHKSTSSNRSFSGSLQPESAAYEFLHNTFGEFLVADFLVRLTVSQVQTVVAMDAVPILRDQVEARLSGSDTLDLSWFGSLIHTPLFSRPVVMEMFREWAPVVFYRSSVNSTAAISAIDRLLRGQIARVINGREMHRAIRVDANPDVRDSSPSYPLLGYLAIYSINLILIRLMASEQPYVFDEGGYPSYEDGAKPWDRLAHLWRSWFAISVLSGLSSVLQVVRHGSVVRLSLSSDFGVDSSDSRLSLFRNVVLSLGDNESAVLASIALHDAESDSSAKLDLLQQSLVEASFDLDYLIATRRVVAIGREVHMAAGDELRRFLKAASPALTFAITRGSAEDSRFLCEHVANILLPHGVSWRSAAQIDDVLFDCFSPDRAAKHAIAEPECVFQLFKLAQRLTQRRWIYEFVKLYVLHVTTELLRPHGELAGDERRRRDVARLELLVAISRDVNVRTSEMALSIGSSPQQLEEAFGASSSDSGLPLILRFAAFLSVMVHFSSPDQLEQLRFALLTTNLARRIGSSYPVSTLGEVSVDGFVDFFDSFHSLFGVEALQDYVLVELSQVCGHIFSPLNVFSILCRNTSQSASMVRILALILGDADGTRLFTNTFKSKEFQSLDLRMLLDVSLKNWEETLAFVRLVERFGGYAALRKEWVDRLNGLFKDVAPVGLAAQCRSSVGPIVVWMKLAKVLNAPAIGALWCGVLIELSRRCGDLEVLLGSFPVHALCDLQWCVKTSGHGRLMSDVKRFIGGPAG